MDVRQGLFPAAQPDGPLSHQGRGFLESTGTNGRPTDVAIAPDGSCSWSIGAQDARAVYRIELRRRWQNSPATTAGADHPSWRPSSTLISR